MQPERMTFLAAQVSSQQHEPQVKLAATPSPRLHALTQNQAMTFRL